MNRISGGELTQRNIPSAKYVSPAKVDVRVEGVALKMCLKTRRYFSLGLRF